MRGGGEVVQGDRLRQRRHGGVSAGCARAVLLYGNEYKAPSGTPGHRSHHRPGSGGLADSRGTLVDIKSLDTRWFPHFARCLEPLLKSPVKLIWHCDGNLMQMVPRLIEVGLKGFQGFQYEDGMDYEKICKMKTKDGDPLIIMAGVSVTRTLPYGTTDDVKKEIKWAVEHAPKTGFFLSSTSSITPGVPWENIKTFIEAREYYLTHGR